MKLKPQFMDVLREEDQRKADWDEQVDEEANFMDKENRKTKKENNSIL